MKTKKQKINIIVIFVILVCVFRFNLMAQYQFTSDTIETSAGELIMTFIGHGTLMFTINDMVIHIDPVSNYADYSKLPKASLILVTHHHSDHLDINAINNIKSEKTKIICSEICNKSIVSGIVMKNGDKTNACNIDIEAVPAYNIVHMRGNGQPYHPKGEGNGYILTIGDKRIYIAGDTENIPEMKNIKNIDIAFLPMNLPYTMSPEMVVDAVKMIKPEILYPYHFKNTDTGILLNLMKETRDVIIKIRNLQ